MTDVIPIKFLTGAVPDFDGPTICHSRKPKPNTCHAITNAPGRDGWFFLQHPAEERRRDGWWCPDCAHELQQLIKQLGSSVTSEDVPIVPPGRA